MDYNSTYLDHREKILDARIKGVYIKARKELEKTLADFVEKKDRISKAKKALVDAGKMDEDEYKDWLKRTVFRENQWKQKVEHCTNMISESNNKALAIIRQEQYNVYTEGANHQVYEVEKRAHFQPDISFDIYDAATVERMISEKPSLLPPRRINGKKDRAWNQGIIANSVAQGIIQGESIDKIAKRIAKETQRQNDSSMRRYARTAITAAQNAGRIDTMKRTAEMGVKVKKKWLATLDRRTRHSHQLLDGQEEEINRPFESIFGKIMYPGDPEAEPGDVYNCRCTLEYVYPDFIDLAGDAERYDQEEGNPIPDITYEDWKKEKQEQQKEKSFEGFTYIKGEHTIIDALYDVNPDYITGGKQFHNNCGNCTLAYDMRRRGINVEAQGRDGMYLSDWKKSWDGFNPIKVTSRTKVKAAKEIEETILSYGEGARASIFGVWDGREWGHFFNAEVKDGKVHFVDSQPYGKMMKQKDVSEYFTRMKPSSIEYGRTDNLEVNKNVVKDRVKQGRKK